MARDVLRDHTADLTRRITAALALLQPVAAVEDLRTHHEHCHQHHAGCLAARIIATLTGGDPS